MTEIVLRSEAESTQNSAIHIGVTPVVVILLLMAETTRDPVHSMPFLPKPVKTGSGGRSISRWRREVEVVRMTNGVVQVLRAMDHGELGPELLREAEFGPASHPQMRSSQGRELSLSLKDDVDKFLGSSCGNWMKPDAALGRLLGLDRVPGPSDKESSAANRVPRRGDIWPLKDVGAVALPGEEVMPIPLVKLSEKCKYYLENVNDLMLRPASEVANIAVPPMYNDPMLENKFVKLKLLRRMYRAQMLRGVATSRSEVGMFFVVKKVHADGRLELRMIFDERRGNRHWRRPPWTGMSGSGAMAWMDYSQFRNETGEVCLAGGDIPNYYYCLEMPVDISEWFIIGGITVGDLKSFMMKEGEQCELDGTFIALKVVPMGWCWAVFLAQQCICELVLRSGPPLVPENQVVEGSIVSPATVKVPLVHSEFIDDFAVIGWVSSKDLVKTSDADGSTSLVPSSTSPLMEAYSRAATTVRASTLDVHKEEFGMGKTHLGIQVGPGSRLLPPREKALVLIQAGKAIASRKYVKVSWVEQMLGMFGWFFLLCRGALSIFFHTYSFVNARRRETDFVEMPMNVRVEMMAAAKILPVIFVDLTLPWSREVLMSDASYEGAGVVSTHADISEILEESRWCPRGGWTLFTGNEEELGRREVSLVPDLEEYEFKDMDMEFSQEEPEPPLVTVKVYRFLHLFSGHRRDGDLADWLSRTGQKYGVVVLTTCADKGYSDTWDFTKEKNREAVMAMLWSGHFDAVGGGPPCSTWSAARYAGDDGPPPLRSRLHPWGLPGLGRSYQNKVNEHNILMLFMLEALGVAFPEMVGFMEHPADWGRDPYPSVWATESWQSMQRKFSLMLVEFDQCMMGSPARKSTGVGGNFEELSSLDGIRCTHGRHPALIGREADGSFRTRAAQAYPSDMCRRLSEVIVQAMLRTRAGENTEVTEEMQEDSRACQEYALGAKLPVPPIAHCWDPISRWKELFRWTWDLQEHINLLELRAAFAAYRHACRSTRSWRCRHMLFVDNQVVLGIISKGRSSKAGLNHILRRIGALALATRCRFYVRWVPTKRNYADGPSRGQSLGVAMESVPTALRLPERAPLPKRFAEASG